MKTISLKIDDAILVMRKRYFQQLKSLETGKLTKHCTEIFLNYRTGFKVILVDLNCTNRFNNNLEIIQL